MLASCCCRDNPLWWTFNLLKKLFTLWYHNNFCRLTILEKKLKLLSKIIPSLSWLSLWIRLSIFLILRKITLRLLTVIKIPLVADNTLELLSKCNVISHGVDIVVHSATKFIKLDMELLEVLSSTLVNLTGRLQANSHSWLTRTHLTYQLYAWCWSAAFSLPFVHNFVTQGLPWHLSMLSCSCKGLETLSLRRTPRQKILKKS